MELNFMIQIHPNKHTQQFTCSENISNATINQCPTARVKARLTKAIKPKENKQSQ
jgi:hypothetical protein